MNNSEQMINTLTTILTDLREMKQLLDQRARRLGIELIKYQQDKMIDHLFSGTYAAVVVTPELAEVITNRQHIEQAINNLQYMLDSMTGKDKDPDPAI